MDLEALNYETIVGTPDKLAQFAKQLKKNHHPFQWVTVTRTTQPEQGTKQAALKISRDLLSVLLG